MVLNPLRAFLKSALHSITGYGSDFKKAPQHNRKPVRKRSGTQSSGPSIKNHYRSA